MKYRAKKRPLVHGRVEVRELETIRQAIFWSLKNSVLNTYMMRGEGLGAADDLIVWLKLIF